MCDNKNCSHFKVTKLLLYTEELVIIVTKFDLFLELKIDQGKQNPASLKEHAWELVPCRQSLLQTFQSLLQTH